MLLEKQIMEKNVVLPQLKRQKTSARTENTNDTPIGDWKELAKLYRSIEEIDFFQNIYERKISSDQSISHAINAEILGDYRLAYDIYQKGLFVCLFVF